MGMTSGAPHRSLSRNTLLRTAALLLFVAGVALYLTSCGATWYHKRRIKDVAARVFRCSADDISVHFVRGLNTNRGFEGTYTASGCGHSQTYKCIPNDPNGGALAFTCTAVADATVACDPACPEYESSDPAYDVVEHCTDGAGGTVHGPACAGACAPLATCINPLCRDQLSGSYTTSCLCTHSGSSPPPLPRDIAIQKPCDAGPAPPPTFAVTRDDRDEFIAELKAPPIGQARLRVAATSSGFVFGLVVNDKRLDLDIDPGRQVHLRGHDNVLDHTDVQTIAMLQERVWPRLALHGDDHALSVRHVAALTSWLAEAPARLKLDDRVIDISCTPRSENWCGELGRCVSRTTCNAAPATAPPARDDVPSDCSLTWTQSGDDDGLTLISCCGGMGGAVEIDWPETHDACGHWLREAPRVCGWRQAAARPLINECEGRCGQKCSALPVYSQDCFDHDWCTHRPDDGHTDLPAHLQMLHPDCGDEFWEATDDTLSIYLNPINWFFSCGSEPISDNEVLIPPPTCNEHSPDWCACAHACMASADCDSTCSQPCVSSQTPFTWSCNGPIPGKVCRPITEPNDPAETPGHRRTWDDNFLCATDANLFRYADGPQDIPSRAGCYWACSRPFAESREPASHGWGDNVICHERCPHGVSSCMEFEFSDHGPIAGRTCLQLLEPDDPDGWNDNYLCWPSNCGSHLP